MVTKCRFLMAAVLVLSGARVYAQASAITIDIGDAQGIAGSTVTFEVRLNGAADGDQAAAIRNDIGFPSVDEPIIAKSNGTPDCTLDPVILTAKPNSRFSYSPNPPPCTVGTTCEKVTANLVSLADKNPVRNGLLYTCKFAIPAAAAVGTTYVMTNLNAVITTAANKNIAVTGASRNGTIHVVIPPPSPTPIPTRTPRLCNCPGDWDGNGQVTIDEVVKALNAALEGCHDN